MSIGETILVVVGAVYILIFLCKYLVTNMHKVEEDARWKYEREKAEKESERKEAEQKRKREEERKEWKRIEDIVTKRFKEFEESYSKSMGVAEFTFEDGSKTGIVIEEEVKFYDYYVNALYKDSSDEAYIERCVKPLDEVYNDLVNRLDYTHPDHFYKINGVDYKVSSIRKMELKECNK